MSKFQQSGQIPHRQFPKQQYQKLSHHIWAWTIVIIIAVMLIGIIFIMATNDKPANHHVAHHVKSSQPVQKSRLIHHKPEYKPKNLNVTLKQGEKILGHWLIKLNYSPNQSQKILTNYQNRNQIQEKTLAHQLANDKQPNQVKKLINHNLSIKH